MYRSPSHPRASQSAAASVLPIQRQVLVFASTVEGGAIVLGGANPPEINAPMSLVLIAPAAPSHLAGTRYTCWRLQSPISFAWPGPLRISIDPQSLISLSSSPDCGYLTLLAIVVVLFLFPPSSSHALCHLLRRALCSALLLSCLVLPCLVLVSPSPFFLAHRSTITPPALSLAWAVQFKIRSCYPISSIIPFPFSVPS
jgi:hypothetical protein